MEDALSPNSAFLSYLNTIAPVDQLSGGVNPTSLPPSAFFPQAAPRRDTPEDTPSSKDSESPEIATGRQDHDFSPDSEEDGADRAEGSRRRSVMKKRKAGHGHTVEQLSADDGMSLERIPQADLTFADSDDVLPSGHEDKRAHGNDARRGGRKSNGDEASGGSGGKREQTKAARRKEQNRAAQKAFRERRENKVKDLEGKVAELEQKSYGVSVENENLRAILKRLQEENVKLKQSAFTFSMPMNGQQTGQSPPQAAQQRTSVPVPKPPTPQSMPSDDALRSVHDVVQPQTRTSQSSSTSPVSQAVSSETSAPSSVQPQLFDQDAFNAFIANAPKDGYRSMSTDGSSVSPPSTTEEKKNEFDNIFRSWGVSNTGWRNGIDPSAAPAQPNTAQQQSNPYATYFGNLPSAPGAAQRPNPFTSLATAYREHTQQYDAQLEAQTKQEAASKSPAQPDWSGINNASVDAFLANLAGANTSGDDKLPVAGDDDYFQNEFDAQLQQILQASATSPSNNAFLATGAGTDVNPFSPSKYLNMSPSPYANSDSQSQSQSPESVSKTDSASGTPASSAPSSGDLYGSGVDTLGKPSETIHIMDDGGNVMTAHQIIDQYGMHAKIEKGQIDALVIDDLCDAMKAKATCKDGVSPAAPV